MAINYTVSYTFSPNTTISSSQVNTNFSDNANTWNGIEAGTKTLSLVKVDSNPTTALALAPKQYVDRYANWRRPVLQYASTTVVNIETGLNGTSGSATILFPDGDLRSDSTTSRINCNFAQNAVLSGTAQSGIRSGSVANNTWYAIYAVKVSDSTTNFVTVADTVLPVQGSFSTLNSNLGTSSWVYLGLVRYGDGNNAATNIVKFFQAGNKTIFYNAASNNVTTMPGIFMAGEGSGSTSTTYTYASGTGSAQIPSVIGIISWLVTANSSGTSFSITSQVNSSNNWYRTTSGGTTQVARVMDVLATEGLIASTTTSTTRDICLISFIDGVLGVGSNPAL